MLDALIPGGLAVILGSNAPMLRSQTTEKWLVKKGGEGRGGPNAGVQMKSGMWDKRHGAARPQVSLAGYMHFIVYNP